MFQIFKSFLHTQKCFTHMISYTPMLLLLLLLSRFSCAQLCVTPQTADHQAFLSMGFSRQEYWSGLSFPSPMHACMLSCVSHVQLCVTLWTAAHQALLSMGFSKQEYCSGLPFPSPYTPIITFYCPFPIHCPSHFPSPQW